MRRFARCCSCLFLVPAALIGSMIVPGVSTAAPTKAPIDQKASALHARTFKSGIASGLAHDHVIAATRMSGTIQFDPEAPAVFSIDVVVPTAGLQVDNPRLRKKYGLEGEIDADDRETITEHMTDEDQLHVRKHPEIRFRSTTARQTDKGAWMVEGELTLRGRTQPVSLPVRIEMDQTRFRGEGKLSITHAQFGFEPYSALLGAVSNQERIDLHLVLVARVP